jgi:hypothetical protein
MLVLKLLLQNKPTISHKSNDLLTNITTYIQYAALYLILPNKIINQTCYIYSTKSIFGQSYTVDLFAVS